MCGLPQSSPQVVPASQRPPRVGPDPVAALADPPSGRRKPPPYGGQVLAAHFVQGRCHGRGVSKVDDQLVTRDLGLRGGRQPCRPLPG